MDILIDSVPTGAKVRGGVIPFYASNNAHMFYLIFEDPGSRTAFIQRLADQGILAIFHYLPLHQSPFYRKYFQKESLPWAEHYAACLVRLPLYYGLEVHSAVQDSMLYK